MNLFISRLLVSPIMDRGKRRVIREMMFKTDFRKFVDDIFKYFKFKKKKISSNSVLLIETNICHGEVIGGYISYFQKMGYDVDVIINSEVMKENPFCRLDMKKTNIYDLQYLSFNVFLNSVKISEYRHVFVMSSDFYLHRGVAVQNVWPALKKHPSLFIVEHDLINIDPFHEREYLKKKHIITLGHFNEGVFVSPILFGSVNTDGEKHKTTVFITVGLISPERRNYHQLVAAAEYLTAKNLPFKIVVVGLGKLDALPETIRSHIEITGRLSFSDMFNKVEEADFYLPLLDDENPDHNRYITTGVTGGAQLIYAFAKIPVINPYFASFYGFNEDNAILAKDLGEGMEQAVLMNNNEYSGKKASLKNLAASLVSESERNLSEILLKE